MAPPIRGLASSRPVRGRGVDVAPGGVFRIASKDERRTTVSDGHAKNAGEPEDGPVTGLPLWAKGLLALAVVLLLILARACDRPPSEGAAASTETGGGAWEGTVVSLERVVAAPWTNPAPDHRI